MSYGDGGYWKPIVAVPARNEAERLPALIEALGQQTWLAKTGRELPVVLVLNNCDDGSAAVAAVAAARQPNLAVEIIETEFSPDRAHVGSARQLAINRASELGRASGQSVLLTTDADAVPLPTWIEANLRAIATGADLVGGHIIGDKAEEARLGPQFLRRAARQLRYAGLVDQLATLIDPVPYDPWPRHSDHTGASLAVRADVYAAVGGLAALRLREDLDFVNRVRGAGYRLRHPLDVRVKVSARLDGRASGGMSDCLKAWLQAEQQGLPHLVEDPCAIAARLRRRRMCRDLAARSPRMLVNPTEALAVPGWTDASLDRFRRSSLNIAALVELVAPDEPDAPASVHVETAIAQIERMILDQDGEIRVA